MARTKRAAAATQTTSPASLPTSDRASLVVDQNLYLDRLEAERDNISAALRWLCSAGRIDQGLLISGGLWRFWHLRAHLLEGSQLLDDLLSAPLGQTDTAARGGLAAAGSLAYWQLDYGAAEQRYAQALDCFLQAGDAAGIAEAHCNLGFATQIAGDSQKARGLFEAAASEYDNLGDEHGRLYALTGIALVDYMTGNTARARQQAQASLQRFRALGDRFAASSCLSLLGSILRHKEASVKPALSCARPWPRTTGPATCPESSGCCTSCLASHSPATRPSGRCG